MASVISVEQNENISMLSWLTIIYLASAFIVVRTLSHSPFQRQNPIMTIN
jgi:hypothetical protein